MHFSETSEPHSGQEALIKIALLDTTCDFDPLSKPRCRGLEVRNTLRQAECSLASRLNKRQEQAHGWQIHQISGNWVLLQVCIWNRCSEKKRDRTYRAHLRCLPSAVLRTSFKERVIGWDQSRKENGESTGLRLKTHESCHNWAGAIKVCTWISFCVLLCWYYEMCAFMEEKQVLKSMVILIFLMLECPNIVCLLI